MKFVSLLVSSLLLILHHSPAWSLETIECDYAGNQAQMNACAIRDFEMADKELNTAYKQLMNSLPKSKHNELKMEQRAWLKRRDPTCQKEANKEAEGGSLWPMLYLNCRSTLTEARIKKIQKWNNR